jgi:hypothetical protein
VLGDSLAIVPTWREGTTTGQAHGREDGYSERGDEPFAASHRNLSPLNTIMKIGTATTKQTIRIPTVAPTKVPNISHIPGVMNPLTNAWIIFSPPLATCNFHCCKYEWLQRHPVPTHSCPKKQSSLGVRSWGSSILDTS